MPVADAMSLTAFAPSRPVFVLHIHSVDDPRVLYDGGLGPPFPLTRHREFHQPVDEVLEDWRWADGCPIEPTSRERRQGRPGGTGSGLPERVIGAATTIVDAAFEAWAFASRFSRD